MLIITMLRLPPICWFKWKCRKYINQFYYLDDVLSEVDKHVNCEVESLRKHKKGSIYVL